MNTPRLKIGDRAKVVHWGSMYTVFKRYKDNKSIPVFLWETEIPESSELITTPQDWKDCEYIIIEIIKHPSFNVWIYLAKSDEDSYLQMGEKGFIFTKKQLGKWNKDMSDDELKKFPKELLKKLYDIDQMALFGSTKVKTSIGYEYIPAEYMEENVPLIISTYCKYDGGSEQDEAVKNGAEIISWKELKERFPNNKFN